MRERVLPWLAEFVWRRVTVIIVFSVLLAALSAYFANQVLQIDVNTDHLVSPKRPFMKQYQRLLDEFGDLEFIQVVVADTGDTPRAQQCVDELTARLRRISDLPAVFSAIEPDEQLRIATRAMPDAELEGLSLASGAFETLRAQKGAVDVVNEATTMLKRLLGGEFKTPEQQRRAGATAIFLLNAVASARPGSQSEKDLAFLLGHDQQREYFKSDSGKLYFITIVPDKDYSTLSVIEEPLRKIRAVIDEVRREFPGVDIGLSGKPVLQADEMATTDADMTKAAVLAFALCSVLFMISFRSVWQPLLAVGAFGCAAAWTYGFATLSLGRLNLLSIVFILILVGIGLDYGVHIISRFREHRKSGDVRDSIAGSIMTAGKGNITGVTASAVVFFMALLTNFQGLRELGLLAGAGLLLCMIAMTVLLPALLAAMYRKRADAAQKLAPAEIQITGTSTKVKDWFVGRPWLILVSAAAITIGLSWAPWRLRFEHNLLKLQAEGLESIEWEHRILQDSTSNTWFGAVIVPSEPAVAQVIEKARQRPTIGAVHSVLDIIQPSTPERVALRAQLHQALDITTQPSSAPETETEPEADDDFAAASQPDAATQPETVRALQRSMEKMKGALDLLAAGAALQAPEEAKMLRQLKEDLNALAGQMRPQQPRALAADTANRIEQNLRLIAASLRKILEGDKLPLWDAMPDGLRRQFMSPIGKFLVMLHPKMDVWEYQPMREFVNDLRAVDPEVTGAPVTQFESMRDMMWSFGLMSALALLVISAIVTLDFRKARDIALALLPLGLGAVWTAELMGLFGVSFNLANFFSVPILIGLGVNGSVYVLHRHHEGGPTRFSLGSTRRAVIITALNTIIGFGCLMLAHHRGLRSLGLVMTIGCTACLVSSALILPAMLAWIETSKRRNAETSK